MKTRLLLFIVTMVTLLTIPKINFGQINLGAASKFVIYSTGGAVHDNPISHSLVTGDVGYYTSGNFLGFGNVNGVMHPGVDAATTACELALQSAVTQINSTSNDYFPGLLLGNGVVFTPGVYSIPGNATLNLNLILDAQNVSTAQFIIKIQGTFSTTAAAKVKLINGAQACHVFWLVQGQVDMATNTTMRGTVIVNNAAINMATGDSIEGRLLTTTGAITIDGITAFTPTGCGSPVLAGPTFPTMGSIACYAVYSSNGALTNTAGTSTSIGDVGNNGIGSITGWSAGDVTGALHLIQDPSTIQAAVDLSKLYDTLNAMVADIELLYPAQFGNNLVLTPHVYLMNSAATFTNSIYLDAQGNSNAVFVIKITGGSPALTTSTYANVHLINGALAKNVFWLINGAVNINNYSEFKGTIVVPSGAINLVNTGVILEGRALTMIGAITTAGLTVIIPPGCGITAPPLIVTEPVSKTVCSGDSVKFSVAATGSSLTYQWRKGNVNLINGGHISGATSDTLKINPANISDTASNYNVIVSGSLLPNDTSINVSLVVNMPPIIINEPINQNACVGNLVKLFVKASGSNLTYQWRKGSVNLINGVNISGVTSDTLKFNAISISDTSTKYNVIVYGSCLPNDTSINASIIVNIAPLITTEPINKTSCLGSAVYFSVIASGSNLTYQWRKGNVNLINGVNISGATSDTLRINAMLISDTASNYNVIVSGTCLPKDTSINVALLRALSPIITTEPSNIIACGASSANFSVSATGTSLSYQWRKGNVNLINGGNITGATTSLLTINPISSTDTSSVYNVIVYGGCLPNDTSINASLQLINTSIITPPVNKTVCTGNSVSFTVSAVGASLTYQWRKGNVNLINGGNISGATSAILTINPATISDTASNYNVVVTGSCTSINSTSSATNLKLAGGYGILSGVGISSTGFSVISNMNIGISPGVRSSITGFPPATVVNGAIYASDDVAPPGIAALLIQAKQDLTDAYLFAEGATAPAPATVSGDLGGLTLTPGIYKSTSTLLIQSGNLTLDGQGNSNATWIFQIAAGFTTIGGAGGNVILTGGAKAKNIIWQVGSSATIGNGTSFKGNILALSSITMNTGSSIDGRLLARNGAVVLSGTNIINSPTDTSTNITNVTTTNVSLVVNPLPVTSVITGNATPNCSAIAQIYSVVNTIGSTYVWTVPTGAVITAGGGTNSITVTFGTTNGNISVIETNSNGCVGIQVTKAITLLGCGLSANFTANITSVCSGSSVIFTNTSLGTTPLTTYSWSFGNGATPATITGIGPHTVIYTGSGSSTVSLTITYGASNTKTILNYITVIPNNTIALTSAVGTDNQILCANTAITNITYATTGATGATFSGLPAGLTANWLANVVTISGTPTATGSFNYTVNLTGGCGTISNNGAITINPLTGATSFILGATSVCQNAVDETYTATAANSTSIVYSVLPASAGVMNSTTAVMNWDANFSGTATITAVSTGLCGTTTASIVVTVIPLPIAIATSNSPVCVNSPLNLTAQTVAGGSYSWTGPNSFTALVQNPVISSAILTDAGNYTLIVTANGCTSVASTIAVIVNICPSDLAVVKTVNVMHPLMGTLVVFTIVATNNGPYTATGVIATDILQSGYSFVSAATNSGGVYNPATGIWTIGNQNVGASNILYITAMVNSTGSYMNTATITGNEIDLLLNNNTSSIVTDPTDFFIPQGFSPNGDGINDLFVIRGIEIFPANSIQIYNRWGNKVFDASPYRNTWDGKANNGLIIGDGDRLPIGTYFYLLNLGDNSDVIKGTIYLNR